MRGLPSRILKLLKGRPLKWTVWDSALALDIDRDDTQRVAQTVHWWQRVRDEKGLGRSK